MGLGETPWPRFESGPGYQQIASTICRINIILLHAPLVITRVGCMIELLVALSAIVDRETEGGKRNVVVVRRDGLRDFFTRVVWGEKRIGTRYEWPEDVDEDLRELEVLEVVKLDGDRVVIDVELFKRRIRAILPFRAYLWTRGVFEDDYTGMLMREIWRTARERAGELVVRE